MWRSTLKKKWVFSVSLRLKSPGDIFKVFFIYFSIVLLLFTVVNGFKPVNELKEHENEKCAARSLIEINISPTDSPKRVGALKVSDMQATEVTITWTKPDDTQPITGYLIERQN